MSILRVIARLGWAAVIVLFNLVFVQDGAAQVRRYQPQTPTISPYLNLTRFNPGGLPNYYALVRPEIQQQQINVRGRALLGQQQGEITQLQSKVQQVQRGVVRPSATGTGSWFMLTGKQSRFLDTTRYFPEPVARRGRR